MRKLLLLMLLLVPLHAQETMIREVYDPKTDTHVEVLALFTQPARSGFFPVRVKIANNLQSERSIRLDFKSSIGYDSRICARSSFYLTAPAGKAVTRDIMVPVISGNNTTSMGDWYQFECELGGSLGSATNSIRNETMPTMPSVLISDTLHTVNASRLDTALKSTATATGSYYGNVIFAGKFDPGQLPSDWLAFSGYDSVILTDSDWSDVPSGARNAIFSWINMGGQLVIYSTGKPTPAMLGIPADLGHGTCEIQPIRSDLVLVEAETINLVHKRNPVPAISTSIANDFSTSWPLQDHFGAKDFHYGLFILVLVLFGIMVGPVNLFVLAKSGQRHRLFITTPLISLGASLLLVVLIIFQDGFGGAGMRRVLMEIRPDEGQNTACIHQEQISRSGILTGSGFTVDPASQMAQVPIATSRWARFTNAHDTRATFNLQPSAGKMEGSGDWWLSRSEQGQLVRTVQPSRGRIEATANAGEYVSSFDFPLETVYVLDASKQWLRAESIQTGKPFKPVPTDQSAAESAITKEINGFSDRNRTLLTRAHLRTNHFVATTTQAPGVDTLDGIRWKETRTVITGPLK